MKRIAILLFAAPLLFGKAPERPKILGVAHIASLQKTSSSLVRFTTISSGSKSRSLTKIRRARWR
jgi:hypothetical protein